MRLIFPGLHYQLYTNDFVNYSLTWDGLQVTLMELGRTTMAIFMIFHSNMEILKNSTNMNMIRMLPMHAYPWVKSDLGLYRNFIADPFSVDELLVFNPMTSASASLMMMEISTTTHSIICKHILPIIQLYSTTKKRKAAATTAAMKNMKSTATPTMTLMNRQKRNKMLGVAVTVLLIVMCKK